MRPFNTHAIAGPTLAGLPLNSRLSPGDLWLANSSRAGSRRPAPRLALVQALRGKENFHITGIPILQEPDFVKALGYVKKAAALANRDLGVLEPKIARALCTAQVPQNV